MGSSLDSLNEPLRSAVRALVADARAAGISVTWTSTRRTREEQAQLRIANGCPDVWTAPASACRVPTAIPGTSNHETGNAIDFTNTPANLAAVAERAYRFRIQRTVRGEPWHYEHMSNSRPAPDAPAPPSVAGSHPSGGLPIPGVGGVLDGARAVGDALALLVNPDLWLRILQVVAGFVAVGLGLTLLGFDLRGKVAGAVVKAAT